MKKTHSHLRCSPKAPFPEEQHVLTPKQRELPAPAVALAHMTAPSISERAHVCAATVHQEQREARIRREALAILEREDARRDAIAHSAVAAPTVREDLQAVRRRPLDAPMATYPGELPDPFAQQVWDAISTALVAPARSLWAQVQTPLAFAVWSLACFWLGRLTA